MLITVLEKLRVKRKKRKFKLSPTLIQLFFFLILKLVTKHTNLLHEAIFKNTKLSIFIVHIKPVKFYKRLVIYRNKYKLYKDRIPLITA